MKLFIDSNIRLRFLVRDNEKNYSDCCQLLNQIEIGKHRPYTSSVVLLEVYYVLTSTYKVEKIKAIEDIKNIISTRNLTLIDKTDFKKALEKHIETKVKLTNCLIASQVPLEVIVVTYDHEFHKLKNVKVAVPFDILESI